MVIPVSLMVLAKNGGAVIPLSVKTEYVARVLPALDGSRNHEPSTNFTRNTPGFSAGPCSFAGFHRLKNANPCFSAKSNLPDKLLRS